MRQLIFVVETDSSTQSDDRYLRKLMISRYDFSSNEIKSQFIHMGGKNKFSDKSIISQINKYIKRNNDGDNFVIYCFDTDKIDCLYNYKKEFQEEKNFCDKYGYYMIWFNYDIEYVLLGKIIESNNKKHESMKYYTQKNTDIPIKKLFGKNEESKGYSNVFLILDLLLPIKQ